MAQFTKVNGDFQPVLRLDAPDYANNGLNAVVSGATVQPQGPKLDFFTITFTGTGTTGAQLLNTVNAIQQLATVYMYEFTSTTNDTLAVAVYPTGAWDTTSLDAAVTTAAGEAVTVAASATFTG